MSIPLYVRAGRAENVSGSGKGRSRNGRSCTGNGLESGTGNGKGNANGNDDGNGNGEECASSLDQAIAQWQESSKELRESMSQLFDVLEASRVIEEKR